MSFATDPHPACKKLQGSIPDTECCPVCLALSNDQHRCLGGSHPTFVAPQAAQQQEQTMSSIFKTFFPSWLTLSPLAFLSMASTTSLNLEKGAEDVSTTCSTISPSMSSTIPSSSSLSHLSHSASIVSSSVEDFNGLRRRIGRDGSTR